MKAELSETYEKVGQKSPINETILTILRFYLNGYTQLCGFQPVTTRHYADFSKWLYITMRIPAGDYASLCGFQQMIIHNYADYSW